MSSSPDTSSSARAIYVPIWLLVMLTFCGTLAMHMFVPALPVAGRDLHASMGLMQSTISLYIVGLAVGQLIYGPISDAVGRRPVLMFGLTLYALAGFAAAFAPAVQALIAARVLQALGGCTGIVLARTIIRDTSASTDAIRRMALMNLITMIGPGVAPMLGVAIIGSVGWRYIFVLLALLGIVNALLTWRMLPETGRPSGHVHLRRLLRDYGATLRSPGFIGFAVGGSCATMAVYAIVVAAPFILVQQLQRPDREVGYLLFVLMLTMAVGNMTTSRLVGKVAIEKILIRANLLSLGAACLLVIVTLTELQSVWLVGACMGLFTMGIGMAGPGAVTKAISVNPRLTGTAAGLYGACQMLVGAIASALPAVGSNPAISCGVVLVTAGVIAQLCLRSALAQERRRKRRLAHGAVQGADAGAREPRGRGAD